VKLTLLTHYVMQVTIVDAAKVKKITWLKAKCFPSSGVN